MWVYEHSIETEAAVASVWKLYRDVSTWPWWDLGIEKVELDAAFVPGSTGHLILKDKTVVPFRLETVIPMQTFAYLATEPELPAPCEVVHILRASGNLRTRITHKVTLMASLPPAQDAWANALTQRIDDAMDALAYQALSDS